jgi:hypothetical protein
MEKTLMLKTPTEEYVHLFNQMYILCEKNGWGDPFSYARSREIYIANKLGHKIGITFSGPDGYEDTEMKIPAEYKSTTCKNIKASYTGISVHDTWEKQLLYLQNEKICKYQRHYFARFDGSKLAELWCMDCDKVLIGILPKIKKMFENSNRGADPRLSATLSKKYIYENAKQIV